MKNSTDQLQESVEIKRHLCSEKTCITCFENRGCIYEQYPAATYDMDQSHPEIGHDVHLQLSNKRA